MRRRRDTWGYSQATGADAGAPSTRRRRIRAQQLNQKLWILRLVVLAAFAALAVQLGRLQLVQGGHFQQRAALNQLRIEPVIPSRGLIYDRNGVPVVENVPGFSAAVVAADIPDGQRRCRSPAASRSCSACPRSRRRCASRRRASRRIPSRP